MGSLKGVKVAENGLGEMSGQLNMGRYAYYAEGCIIMHSFRAHA